MFQPASVRRIDSDGQTRNSVSSADFVFAVTGVFRPYRWCQAMELQSPTVREFVTGTQWILGYRLGPERVRPWDHSLLGNGRTPLSLAQSNFKFCDPWIGTPFSSPDLIPCSGGVILSNGTGTVLVEFALWKRKWTNLRELPQLVTHKGNYLFSN